MFRSSESDVSPDTHDFRHSETNRFSFGRDVSFIFQFAYVFDMFEMGTISAALVSVESRIEMIFTSCTQDKQNMPSLRDEISKRWIRPIYYGPETIDHIKKMRTSQKLRSIFVSIKLLFLRFFCVFIYLLLCAIANVYITIWKREARL